MYTFLIAAKKKHGQRLQVRKLSFSVAPSALFETTQSRVNFFFTTIQNLGGGGAKYFSEWLAGFLRLTMGRRVTKAYAAGLTANCLKKIFNIDCFGQTMLHNTVASAAVRTKLYIYIYFGKPLSLRIGRGHSCFFYFILFLHAFIHSLAKNSFSARNCHQSLPPHPVSVLDRKPSNILPEGVTLLFQHGWFLHGEDPRDMPKPLSGQYRLWAGRKIEEMEEGRWGIFTLWAAKLCPEPNVYHAMYVLYCTSVEKRTERRSALLV